MVTDRARIDSLEAGLACLAEGGPTPERSLVVLVDTAVPEWLGELVVAASEAGHTVSVEAVPAVALVAEALDGWQIGVCTAALGAGAADVLGVDPKRVLRVRTIVASLAAAAPKSVPAS